jgi:DNA-directed RNA polymerase subunit K/omega
MPIPPRTVRNNAKRALEARDEAPPSRKAMTPVGIARANQLARGDNVSVNTLRRMVSYLSRARDNYQRAKAKGLSASESPAIQAYLGWGGSAALTWARSELAKAEQ